MVSTTENVGESLLHSRRLSYIVRDGFRNKAAILDLETGKRSVCINGDGPIHHILMSDHYLLLESMGR